MPVYKNISDKVKPIKIGGRWIDVQPGKLITLPRDLDELEPGLVKVEQPKNEVKPEPKPDGKKKDELDLNNDGKVDKKDVSIAAKVMGKQKKTRRRKSKKKNE